MCTLASLVERSFRQKTERAGTGRKELGYMNSHIDSTRLQEAAERKIRLGSQEWKHIEECRQCLDDLTEAVRVHGRSDAYTAA